LFFLQENELRKALIPFIGVSALQLCLDVASGKSQKIASADNYRYRQITDYVSLQRLILFTIAA
jgi:hypothetical protein